jgi:dephospho-CoA kinase
VITAGVTGGLGSGKTTACKFFEERGAYIFDADKVAKELLKNNTELQKRISDEFGVEILENGEVDTQKLAKVAFASEENQNILNNIVHPYVIDEFNKRLEEVDNETKLFVVDAPLIFESGFDSHLDHTVLIYAKYKTKLVRALRRGKLSREQIIKRMELQMPDEEKKELASYVINNDGTVEQLKEAVYRLYNELTS